jgi:hypothetical protein
MTVDKMIAGVDEIIEVEMANKQSDHRRSDLRQND